MDVKSLIASLVQSLAWPAAIILVVVLFRPHLARVIAAIRRLSYRGLEVNLEREIGEIEKDVQQDPVLAALPDLVLREERPREPYRDLRLAYKADDLRELSEISPREAVLNGWSEVESAARQTAHRLALSSEPNIPLGIILRKLVERKTISDAVERLILKLRNVRNEAAHSGDFQLSGKEARRFDELALRVALLLRGVNE